MKKAILIALVFGVFIPGVWAVNKIVLPASVTGPMTLDFVQGYRFDPLVSQPALPSNLTITGYPKGTKGYYLVQFAGPIQGAWKERITALGGKFIDYQPHYAFLVRMDESTRRKVEAFPEVRWVGLFQPAYKLYPAVTDGVGPKTVLLVLFYDEDGSAILKQLETMGAGEFVTDFNWINKSLRCKIPVGRLVEVARIPGVAWIEPWSEWELDCDQAQWVIQKGLPPTDTTRTIWRKGIRGEGMIITHTDDGLYLDHCMFRDPSNPNPGVTHRKVIFRNTAQNGWHGTNTAGIVAGDDSVTGGGMPYDGMAPKARLYEQYYGSLSSDWDMNQWFTTPYNGVDSSGKNLAPRTSTSSLSRKDTFNIYIFTDMTMDQFIWNGHRDYLHCNSMGNFGNNTMGHPPVAKDIISVGGLDNGVNATNIYPSSSRGPTADGRRKPTLMTPGGMNITAATNTGACVFDTFGGTSGATPVMTGGMTLMRQYFKEGWYPSGTKRIQDTLNPSAALLKAVAMAGSDPNITGFTVPDTNIGWGRLDLDSSLYFAGEVRKLWIMDNIAGLSTGDSLIYSINVTNGAVPFRVALSWSDYPGTMRAAIILVNNLDLTVTSPGGTDYKGSVYSGGQSTTGGLYDTLNVEECFRLNAPAVGTWKIKVKARNVPQGPQPFGLAATGGISASGVEQGEIREPVLPKEFDLWAIPNPMGDQTEISFALPKPSTAILRIYTLTGQLVKTLTEGQHGAGIFRVSWDGRDLLGTKVPSGVYFYRLETPTFSSTKKMVVVR